jgi:glycosidase
VILAFALFAAVPTEFVYTSSEPARSVHVAGSFNNWNREATPMRQVAGTQTWRAKVDLTPGKYFYKFVVDGARWITDPQAARNEDDGNGNVNSVRFVWPADYGSPADPNDGKVAASALEHRTDLSGRNWVDGELEVRLRTRPGDVSAVKWIVAGRSVPMDVESADDLYAVWIGRTRWNGRGDLRYHFNLHDGDRVLRYDAAGLDAVTETPYRLDPQTFRPFRTPDWVERAVIYQIFPDRFANGSRANDPANVQDWATGTPTYYNRFGGDAEGIRHRLGHLKALGVTDVYFTPVFKSPSNHRYDASDYLTIDPQIGTNAEFARLGREMRGQGISMILDLAFNHTATDFWAFQDIRDRGPQSRYNDWYFIKEHPVVPRENPPYEAWFGFPSMPKLRVLNPETKAYLLQVAERWRRDVPAVRGYRLDVANEVEPDFWRAFRQSIKKADPQFWILGEHWGDARPWLGGDQWDSVMNYPFREAAVRYLAKDEWTREQFQRALTQNQALYARQVRPGLMNLLSSHDTARFLTEAGGRLDRQVAAATLQFTWPGVPNIYYGEEIAMEGGRDPDNRRPMRWDLVPQRRDLIRTYARLAEAKRTVRALHRAPATFLPNPPGAKAFGFVRDAGQDAAVVLINPDDREVAFDVEWPSPLRRRRDVLSGQTQDGAPRTVKVAARSAQVWVNAKYRFSSLTRSAQTPRIAMPIANRSHSQP